MLEGDKELKVNREMEDMKQNKDVTKVEIEYDVKDVPLVREDDELSYTVLFVGYNVKVYRGIDYEDYYNYFSIKSKDEVDYKSIGLTKHNQYSIVISGLSEVVNRVIPEYIEYGVDIEIRHQNGTVYKWVSEGVTKKNKYYKYINKIKLSIGTNIKELCSINNEGKIIYKVIDKKENKTTKLLNKSIKELTKDSGFKVSRKVIEGGIIGDNKGVVKGKVKTNKRRSSRVNFKDVKTKRVVKNDKIKVSKIITKEINMSLNNSINIEDIID